MPSIAQTPKGTDAMRRLTMRLVEERLGQFFTVEISIDPIILSRGDVDSSLVEAYALLNHTLDLKLEQSFPEDNHAYNLNRESNR